MVAGVFPCRVTLVSPLEVNHALVVRLAVRTGVLHTWNPSSRTKTLQALSRGVDLKYLPFYSGGVSLKPLAVDPGSVQSIP